MRQSSQHMIAMAFATVSTLIMLPSQAQNLEALTNANPNTAESSPVVDNVVSSPTSDANTASNSKADLSSVQANNSAAANVPNSQPNVRIPISSRIFFVPSMQQ